MRLQIVFEQADGCLDGVEDYLPKEIAGQPQVVFSTEPPGKLPEITEKSSTTASQKEVQSLVKPVEENKREEGLRYCAIFESRIALHRSGV